MAALSGPRLRLVIGCRWRRAAAAAAILAMAVSVPVAGHSGSAASGISVEPSTVTAGGTVVLAGTGLEPNAERRIQLVGPDMIVPFAAATTDADGMFSVTLTVPAHLPAGTYTFQAIGDETLTAECIVTAAPGGAVAQTTSAAVAMIVSRDRSGLELGALALLVAVSLGVGLLLVVRAERFGRSGREPGAG
jgi:hypothetical protein